MSVYSESQLSEDHIELAAMNYEAQENLFVRLQEAFRMSELSIEEVADELGLGSEEAQDWLYGEVNLTLSQLRQLANAIDAHVTYRAGALRTKYVNRYFDDQFWVSSDTDQWEKVALGHKAFV